MRRSERSWRVWWATRWVPWELSCAQRSGTAPCCPQVPCTGEDGLVALVMAIAAGISAEERRWVKFSELSADLCKLTSEIGLQQVGVLPVLSSCAAVT